MGVRCIPALSGLAAAALLAACATNGIHAGTTAPPAPAVPTRAAATAVTAVPATPASPSVDPRTEKWIDLKVGECVTDLPPANLSRVTVTVVDCATAHLAEVYFVLRWRSIPLSPTSRIRTVRPVASYTGQSVDGSPYSVTYLIDSNMDRTGATAMPSTVLFGRARERSASNRFRPSLT